ncbi:hypothetical protein TKK_0004678 [Trichogramma kaykai]
MKIFGWFGLIENSRRLPTSWYDDQEFASKAREIKILPRIIGSDYHDISGAEMRRAEIETATTPSLSLNNLVRLTPEEAAMILPYRDYYNFSHLKAFSRLRREDKKMVWLHLFEKVSRGFCRLWALYYYIFELRRQDL